MSNDKLLKIGEIAKNTGVSLRTIRYYHELGLIKPEERSKGNFRLYKEDSIAIIKLISNLKELGFHLEEIKELLNAPCENNENYLSIISRTQKVLIAQKKNLMEKQKALKTLADDIDKSLETIEKCVLCRNERGYDLPCKPNCKNNEIHIKI